MASGKAHAIATAVTGGVAAPLMILAGQAISSALAFAGGCLLGLVINPDLDVRRRDTHADTIMRRSVGRTLWWFWNLLWLPYAYLIPCHRHPLSHWPVLGTVLRVIYALSLPAYFVVPAGQSGRAAAALAPARRSLVGFRRANSGGQPARADGLTGLRQKPNLGL